MFSHKLTEDTELRLLEERHAQELTDLTDRNREHLRAWLPWVDTDRTLEDRKNFIRGALQQFAHNKGFAAGIWHEGRLARGYWLRPHRLGEPYHRVGLLAR